MIWAGFLAGFAGSLHCAGMCGPIALAIPGGQGWRRYAGRLLYHGGRTLTYALLGGVVALAGAGASLFHLTQVISIAAGVFMLVWAAGAAGWIRLPENTAAFRISQRVRSGLAGFLRRGDLPSLLGLGMLNGLLPCGLVYLGLVNAALSQTVWQGMLSMAAFGLGTLPLMLGISLAAGWLGRFRLKINRVMPVILAGFAILFIVRGMGLGIPGISPEWVQDAQGNGRAACCKVPGAAADNAPAPPNHAD